MVAINGNEAIVGTGKDFMLGYPIYAQPCEEVDPHGKSAHEPGAKLDSGKVAAGLVHDFSLAMLALASVGDFGMRKYTRGGWQSVPNGEERYDDAKLRHWLKEKSGEPSDADTELAHAAHEAWNALARLDLMLRKRA